MNLSMRQIITAPIKKKVLPRQLFEDTLSIADYVFEGSVLKCLSHTNALLF